MPVVGNTGEVMAIGARKAAAKAMVAAAGVDVPAGEVLRRGERPTVAPPAVVKPADADNSLGVTLVRSRGRFDAGPRRRRSRTRRRSGRGVRRRSGGRCAAGWWSGTASSWACRWRSTSSTRRPGRSAGTTTSSRRDDGGGLRLVAKDNPEVADRRCRRPGDRPGVGRRAPLPRRTRVPGLLAVRLPHRPHGPPGVPRGEPLLLLRARQRARRHGRAPAGSTLDELLATAVTGALKRSVTLGAWSDRCGRNMV